MAIQMVITDAGQAEITNAANNGTAPVIISHVGLGAGQYTADPTQNTLQAQIKQVATISGTVISDNTISVNIKDESADNYAVSEIGLLTDSGTLFAVYSDNTGNFIEKTPQSTLMIDVDLAFTNINATNLTFGDTNFANPQASETVKGVAEIADQTEADTGTDDTKIITPKKLKNVLESAIQVAINNVINAAPGTLDTLDELANALGDDPNFATTMTNALAGKLGKTGNEVRESGLLELKDANFANQLRVHRTTAGAYSVIQYFTAGTEVGKLGFKPDGTLIARLLDDNVDCKIWHDKNDGVGSGLDADLFQGLSMDQFSLSDGKAGHMFASPSTGTGYYAKVCEWQHDIAYSHFHGHFKISSRYGVSKFYIETKVGTPANAGFSSIIVQDNTFGDPLHDTGRIRLLVDTTGANAKVQLWVYVSGWSGGNFAHLDDYQFHGVSMLGWSPDDSSTASSAPNGVSATKVNDNPRVVLNDQFPSALTVNGYGKLPDGRIEQWGTITLSSSHTWVSYNYPIAFPNGVLNLSLNEKTVNTTGDDHMHAIQENPSNLKGSFQVRTTVERTNTYFWRAIGY